MARVIVVGSANVDLVWHGLRLPRPGETVTDGEFVRVPGGKGANQAAAAAALGGDVQFVGCVGADEHGRMIRADLRDRGLDCSRLFEVDEPTGVAVIMVDAAGENAIAVAPGANRALAPATAIDALSDVGSDDVVLCSCEISLDTVDAVVTAATGRDARVVVNPAPARAVFAGAILTPNEHECAELGGVDALTAVAPAVIVTRGERGAVVHRAGRPPHSQPGFAIEAVDTTGAGDAFNGALAWALAGGHDIEEAVALACAAGALATRALGARSSVPNASEVYALVTA